MEKTMLDEFIAFAKEEFGVTIKVHKSDKPDTFDEIFKDCFPGNLQEISNEIYNYSNSRNTYNNISINLTSGEIEMKYDCDDQLFIAA